MGESGRERKNHEIFFENALYNGNNDVLDGGFPVPHILVRRESENLRDIVAREEAERPGYRVFQPLCRGQGLIHAFDPTTLKWGGGVSGKWKLRDSSA